MDLTYEYANLTVGNVTQWLDSTCYQYVIIDTLTDFNDLKIFVHSDEDTSFESDSDFFTVKSCVEAGPDTQWICYRQSGN